MRNLSAWIFEFDLLGYSGLEIFFDFSRDGGTIGGIIRERFACDPRAVVPAATMTVNAPYG